nr:reverse transcriptase domain-containing protein [Tanacetum cinerariifolium]
MADQCTMAKLIRAPTEGYAEAIVVPSILAKQFELKHSLINMMTSNQFFRLDRTILMIKSAARQWLEKEPLHFILTWEDLVSKFINEFFPPQEQQIFVMKFQTFNNDLMNHFMRHGIDTKISFVHALIMSNSVYCPSGVANQIQPPGFGQPNVQNNHNQFSKPQGYNRAICTPVGIARGLFVSVGKFTFLADFVIVDYESDPRVPLILGRPFLRTARALIDVHGEEMILRDGDERLTLNMRHDTSSYSNQPQKESINLINVFNDSSEDFLENLFSTIHQSGNPTFSSHPKLTSPKAKDDVFDPEGGNVLPKKILDLDSTKHLHPPHHINPLSSSTTSSSSLNHLLEDLPFDIEYDLKKIEYMLHHDHIKDIDSILKDSIDQSNLTNLNDNLADTMAEMFTDEHALDYSSPPLYDEYDDDIFKDESDTKYIYDDPFEAKGEKIKESKLLIDELDLLSDFLPSSECDSFLSKDFSKVNALPSTNNEDNVFNLGILIQENLFEVITHVVPEKNEKKIAISHASLMLEDFDPPLYELPFFKEVPGAGTPLSFSSKNEEKVFKPGILTSKEVHSSLILELSHRGFKIFKIIKILKSPMKIFLFSYGEDIHILDVPCLYFYPP